MAAAKSRSRRAAKSRVTPKGATAKRAAPKRATAKRAAPKRATAKRAAPKRATAKRAAPKRATAKSSAPLELAPRATAPAIPNGIGLIAQHLDFTSHDLDGVRRFYTELLGFSKFHHDPAFDYLNITIAPGLSLGFMPPIPGPPEEWRPPREPGIYLIVEDVERAYAALAQKGVSFVQPPTDMPWGDRAAVLRDPEGRSVCIAQHLQKG